MQPALSPHLDEARHGLRARRNYRPGSATPRRKRSDAGPQAVDGVEMPRERRFAEIVSAAQMLRQSMIILLFGDDPFAENSVQRLDVSRRGGEGVDERIGRHTLTQKEFEFRPKRAACPAACAIRARMRPREGPSTESLGRRDRWRTQTM